MAEKKKEDIFETEGTELPVLEEETTTVSDDSADTKPPVRKRKSKAAKEEAAQEEKEVKDIEEPTDVVNLDEEDSAFYSEEDNDMEEDSEQGDYLEDIDDSDIQAVMESAVKTAMEKIFDKRRAFTGSAKERKKMYATKGVIRQGKDSNALSEEQKKKQEADIILAAVRSIPKKILWGVIDGVKEMPTLGTLCVTVKINDTEGYFPVLIPAYQLWPYDENDYKDELARRHMMSELTDRIGAEIPFCVYRFDEISDKMVIGSRLEALQMMSHRYYIDPRKGNEPVGKKAPARVVGVRNDRVRIEVLGAEVTLQNRELSWTALENLKKEFRVGDTFLVKIRGFETFTHTVGPYTYKLVKPDVSRREAMENPAEKWFDYYEINDRVEGVIKTTVESNGVFVNLQGRMDALCTIPINGLPVPGMRCVVQIMNKFEDTKRITGRIVQMFN